MILNNKSYLPIPTIVYLCGTSFIFGVCLTLAILQIKYGIFIIHPYLILSGLIGSIGLFLTALMSLKELMKGE